MICQVVSERVTKEVVGESKGNGPPTKETWWWIEDFNRLLRGKGMLTKCYNKECRDTNWPRRKVSSEIH